MQVRFVVLKGDGLDTVIQAVDEGRIYETIESAETFIKQMQNSVDNGVDMNTGYYVIIPVHIVTKQGED